MKKARQTNGKIGVNFEIHDLKQKNIIRSFWAQMCQPINDHVLNAIYSKNHPRK